MAAYTTGRLNTVIALGACALLLGGCVSREQADAKLAKGCAAGAETLLPEGQKIERVAETKFGPSAEEKGLRKVTLKTIRNDGFLEAETVFECLFDENFGPFNITHSAAIYQVRTGDQVLGKSGDNIVGSASDFIKLTDSVAKAMY